MFPENIRTGSRPETAKRKEDIIMGLFSTNRYSKPGPGVGKDEPEKRRIVVFFEIFFRKIWKLEQVNLIFLMLCIPIVLLMLGLNAIVSTLFKNLNMLLVFLITFSPFGLLGLPLTGMTYITRNFAREEHAFVWADFFDQIKKNWKLSLLHGYVSYFIYFIAFFALRFYYFSSATSWIYLIPAALCLVLLLAFTFSQYYIFQMIVTFNLPYKNILKNGFIFSLAAFLRNFLLTALHLVFWGFTILCIFSPLFNVDIDAGISFPGFFLLLIGLPAISSFLVNFVTYPVIVRFMIKPYYQTDENGTPTGEDGAKDTDHYHPIEEKKTEYVFENGRLIKKMDDVETVFEDRK